MHNNSCRKLRFKAKQQQKKPQSLAVINICKWKKKKARGNKIDTAQLKCEK